VGCSNGLVYNGFREIPQSSCPGLLQQGPKRQPGNRKKTQEAAHKTDWGDLSAGKWSVVQKGSANEWIVQPEGLLTHTRAHTHHCPGKGNGKTIGRNCKRVCNRQEGHQKEQDGQSQQNEMSNTPCLTYHASTCPPVRPERKAQ
jgi:hypothetical protein